MSLLTRVVVEPPTCAICLEALISDLQAPPCGHVAHKDCLAQCQHKCPICRAPFRGNGNTLFFNMQRIMPSQLLSLHENIEPGVAGNEARVNALRGIVQELQANEGQKQLEVHALQTKLADEVQQRQGLLRRIDELDARNRLIGTQLENSHQSVQRHSETVAAKILQAQRAEQRAIAAEGRDKQNCATIEELKSQVQLLQRANQIAIAGAVELGSMGLDPKINFTTHEMRLKYETLLKLYLTEQREWTNKGALAIDNAKRFEIEANEYKQRYDTLANEVSALKRNRLKELQKETQRVEAEWTDKLSAVEAQYTAQLALAQARFEELRALSRHDLIARPSAPAASIVSRTNQIPAVDHQKLRTESTGSKKPETLNPSDTVIDLCDESPDRNASKKRRSIESTSNSNAFKKSSPKKRTCSTCGSQFCGFECDVCGERVECPPLFAAAHTEPDRENIPPIVASNILRRPGSVLQHLPESALANKMPFGQETELSRVEYSKLGKREVLWKSAPIKPPKPQKDANIVALFQKQAQ